MNRDLWKPINWIFFDLDDTLWNFSANSAISLKILYDISPILKKLFKTVDEFVEIYHVNNSLMWDYYSKGKVSTSQLKVERWRRTLATKQFEVLTAVCEELDRNYLDILAQGQERITGASEMLERLTKKYLAAILSNGFTQTQYKKLYYSGLEKFITRTIVSEEIGINKPNPEIFNYAISETGATKPYLMVGDNGETDIAGALRAGWHTIWYNPQNKPFPLTDDELRAQGADPKYLFAVVKNIKEMENAINAFFSQEN